MLYINYILLYIILLYINNILNLLYLKENEQIMFKRMLYAEESEVPIEEYPFMSVNRVRIYMCMYVYYCFNLF